MCTAAILLLLLVLGGLFWAMPVQVEFEEASGVSEVEVFEAEAVDVFRVFSVKETDDYRLQVPGGWIVESYFTQDSTNPSFVHLDSGYNPAGIAVDGPNYGVDIRVLPDAEGPIEAMRAANVMAEDELPPDLAFEVVTEGPYTRYITDDIPSVGGALHVLVTGDQRTFIWFTLQPYDPENVNPQLQEVYNDFWWIMDSLEIK